MAKGITIKNGSGNTIYYPKTVSDLVYDNESSKTVKEQIVDVNDKIGLPEEITFNSSNYWGSMVAVRTGTQIVYITNASSTYNSFIMYVKQGVRYNFTKVQGTINNFYFFNEYPQRNKDYDRSSIRLDNWNYYTPSTDGYLVFVFQISEGSPIFKVNKDEGGLSKRITDTNTRIDALNDKIEVKHYSLVQGTGAYNVITLTDVLDKDKTYLFKAKSNKFASRYLSVYYYATGVSDVAGSANIYINGDYASLYIPSNTTKIRLNVSSPLKDLITSDTTFDVYIEADTLIRDKVDSNSNSITTINDNLSSLNTDIENNIKEPLQDVVNELYDVDEYTDYISDKYVTTAEVVVGQKYTHIIANIANNKIGDKIDVEQYDIFELETYGSNTLYIKPYLITDKDGIVLELAPNALYYRIRKEFPEGAKYMYVNGYQHSDFPKLKLYKSKINAISEKADNAVDKVNTINDIIYEEKEVANENVGYYGMQFNVGDTFTIKGNTTSQNSRRGYIEIDDTFVSAEFSNIWSYTVLVKGYIIIDKNNKVLELAPYGQTKIINQTFTKDNLPEGAYRIYFNNWTGGTHPNFGTIKVVRNYIDKLSVRIDNIDAKVDNNIYPLLGKKFIFFGDSITEGVCNSVNGKLTSYADYIGQLYGATVTNCGVGGSHMTSPSMPVNPNSYHGLFVYNLVKAWYTKDFTAQDNSLDYADRQGTYAGRWNHVVDTLKNTEATDYDAAVIAAGTNDWYGDYIQLGNWDDEFAPMNISTVLREIIKMLLEMNPKLYILVLPPVVRQLQNLSVETWDSSMFSDNYITERRQFHLYDVGAAQIEIAKKHHVQYIDMYNTMGWNFLNWRTFTADGTHPNKLGYMAMANRVGRHIIANYCRG